MILISYKEKAPPERGLFWWFWRYGPSCLPLGQNAAIDQAALEIVLDDCQDHRIALAEVPIGMLGGVKAQTGGAVRHGAEHAAAVLPADDRMRPAARSYSLRMQS